MNNLMLALTAFIASTLSLPVLSMFVEALRKTPRAPERLRWAPEIPIRHVNLNGIKLRYVQAGSGPNLVLLHTLRTQLDLFEKVVADLSGHFTVYAPDLPGHGYSDIPDARYDAGYFADAVEDFLEMLDIRDVMLAGVSIGGAIPLILASRGNSRVTRAVAINPYDYASGHGMARSSLAARLVVAAAGIPVLGETVMRLRSLAVMKSVFDGGVADPRSIPEALLKEMYQVGSRTGHYRAFLRLLRNSASWEAETLNYSNIRIPVRFIWGERDWARLDERELDRALVPDAEMVTVPRGGHFLPLDRPDAVIANLIAFRQTEARLEPNTESACRYRVDVAPDQTVAS